MTNITLSAAVRSNLLSLQNTASLLDITQTRLATGNKVNSALDNPTSYFTAASLNARASDLGNLLDSVSNAIQTIQAANDGITSITKLVESAQSTANQAQQLSATVDQVTTSAQAGVTGSVAIGSDVPGSITSTAVASDVLGLGGLTFLSGDTLTVTLGATSNTISFNNTGGPGAVDLDGADNTNFTGDDATVSDLAASINAAFGATVATFDGTNHLVITAQNSTDSLSFADNNGWAVSALGLATTPPGNPTIGGLSGTLTVGGNTLTFGAGNITNKAQLTTALAGLGGGITGSIDGSGHLKFDGSGGAPFTIGGTIDVNAAFGIAEQTYSAGTTITQVANPARGALISQYNGLLDQIDQLTADAGFNGNNLLAGTSTQLKVVFNESGTSSLTIGGKDTSATGLGLSQLTSTAFDTNTSITSILSTLKTASDTLRADGSSFGSQLSIVQTRQDFTKALINTLQTGASNLTLADSNEEAANLLALQTRQSLSTKALSLASQGDQNVLRLLQ